MWCQVYNWVIKAIPASTTPAPLPPKDLTKAKPVPVPQEEPLVDLVVAVDEELGRIERGSLAAPARPVYGKRTPEEKIMAAVGFWHGTGIEDPTRTQVAGIAGYRPSTGRYRAYIGQLVTNGYLNIPNAGRLELASGVKVPELSKGAAKAELLSVLSGPQIKIVDAALRTAKPISRDALAAATGYEASTGRYRAEVGHLCSLEIFTKPGAGMVAVSDWARRVLA